MTVYEMIKVNDTVAIRDCNGNRRIGQATLFPASGRWLLSEFSTKMFLIATPGNVVWIRKPGVRTRPSRKYVVR